MAGKVSPPNYTTSFTDLHNTSKMIPSVKGFIPIQSSRPP
jgi:hypothetical protein